MNAVHSLGKNVVSIVIQDSAKPRPGSPLPGPVLGLDAPVKVSPQKYFLDFLMDLVYCKMITRLVLSKIKIQGLCLKRADSQ